MNGYTLTWKGAAAPYPVDGSIFRPDTLGALDTKSLRQQTIRIGSTDVALGELFGIETQREPQLTLRVSPDLRLHRLGAQMQQGKLIVEGDAGDDLGASMSGGTIHVRGSAGDRVGGPDTTRNRGMTGGRIIIQGKAGDHVGLRMRRGTIAIAGEVGLSPGYRMLAGTIALESGPFDHPGLEMRRGTLLLLDPDAAALKTPNFREEGVFDTVSFPIIRLMLGDMKLPQILARRGRLPQRMRLFTGDHFELGKGEIWQWVN